MTFHSPTHWIVYALTTATSLGVAPTAKATTLSPAELQSPSAPESVDGWLVRSGTLRERGDYAGAAEAQEHAFDLFPIDLQSTEVGASTAILSAKDRQIAFENDGDLAHLRAGIEILNRWLELAGSKSQAKGLEVRQQIESLEAIAAPLGQAELALAEGQLEQATNHYRSALEALSAQQLAWKVQARLTVVIARAHIDSYDASVAEGADLETHRPKLDTARDLLELRKASRPDDDDSVEGNDLEELLAATRARIEQSDEQRAARARQAQADREANEQRVQAAAEREQANLRDDEDRNKARKNKRWSIVLLASGVAGAAAGASVLGDGVALGLQAQQVVRSQQAEAQLLALMNGDRFDGQSFDASVNEYEDQVRARTVTEIVGGSVLLAGGVVTSTVGLIRLARASKHREASPAKQERRPPAVITLSLGLAATVAGAGLVGDSLVVNNKTQKKIDAEQAEALQLVQVHGDNFDRASFEAAVRERENRARVRITTEIVGGSMLLTAGVAASVVGALGLARSRKREGSTQRAWLRPSLSRSQLGLVLSARF